MDSKGVELWGCWGGIGDGELGKWVARWIFFEKRNILFRFVFGIVIQFFSVLSVGYFFSYRIKLSLLFLDSIFNTSPVSFAIFFLISKFVLRAYVRI
ncbi:hypothetical protein B0J11DRAFT_52064 [Dendryphion nanum]|uniref:Uncharacterized protein n=1 Tax=Dendryphion nanum TaxID=256645 RepID=A0A9P9DKN9_9PLEO|nr:hypothetical protein B0J11DRAFT_52064 [Dendryphion nanum]